MLTQLRTLEDLKQEFFIAIRNNSSDKVTKILPTTVINGFGYAMAKIVQKINYDCAQIESKLFPEYANSTVLDNISLRTGIPPRGGSIAASAVLLFQAAIGTIYPSGTQVITASGVTFQTVNSLTIDYNGFGFALSLATTSGASTNVDANSITTLVSTPPSGHISVTNPFMAINGADSETDNVFRNRLVGAENILSRNTESFYEALITNINPNVIRINTKKLNYIDNSFEISIVQNNLADFSSVDLLNISNSIQSYLPFADYGTTKIVVSNINWTYIDISLQIKMATGGVLSDIAKQMQINLSTYLDLTQWNFGGTVSYYDLISQCENINNVIDIVGNSFLPNNDVIVSSDSLPRIRNFILTDVLTGTTIGNALTPAFWINTNNNVYFTQILA